MPCCVLARALTHPWLAGLLIRMRTVSISVSNSWMCSTLSGLVYRQLVWPCPPNSTRAFALPRASAQSAARYRPAGHRQIAGAGCQNVCSNSYSHVCTSHGALALHAECGRLEV
jgi:hypothetical protein